MKSVLIYLLIRDGRPLATYESLQLANVNAETGGIVVSIYLHRG